MMKAPYWLASMFVLTLVAPLPRAAQAHGGLSMEQDLCKLNVGQYFMHFAGYQQDAQRAEFCEDIPHVGQTIIVLDFIDDALRDMPVEVKIVHKADGPPASAPVAYSLPPAVYARGTITLTHNFAEPGDYVGLVYVGEHRQHAAVFPFSVGADRTTPKVMTGVGVLLLAALGGYFLARQRLDNAVSAARTGESV